MKNKIATLILMMSCFPMTVCAQSVDPTLIVPSNYERLEENLKETSGERSTLKETRTDMPSAYDFHYTSEDGKICIDADNTTVTVPEGDKIAAYHASCGEISQQLADKIYDYFLPEGGYTYTGSDYTKAVIDEEIQAAREFIEQVPNRTDLTEEEKADAIQNMELMIEDLTEQKKTAPEKSTLKIEPTDSTYKDRTYFTADGEESVKVIDADTEDLSRSLYIVSSDAYSIVDSSVHYYGDGEYRYSGVTGTPVEQCSNEELLEIGITQEEAADLVKDFTDKIGTPWVVRDVQCVKGYKDLPDAVDGEEEAEFADHYTAYNFVMSQCTEGVTNAVTSSNQVRDKADDDYYMWCYEMINIIVEPTGIVWVKWDYPITIDDTISDDVSIISFEAAKDIFEHMMPVTMNEDMEQWGDTCKDSKAVVSEVKLELMRVRKSDTDRTGLLIPTWVFYGDASHHYVYEGDKSADFWDTEQKPWILMAVNAVDGSVIDITEGY